MSIAQATTGVCTPTTEIDDWTRMETRLVMYKAERLMSEIERELQTLRAHVDNVSICDSVSETVRVA